MSFFLDPLHNPGPSAHLRVRLPVCLSRSDLKQGGCKYGGIPLNSWTRHFILSIQSILLTTGYLVSLAALLWPFFLACVPVWHFVVVVVVVFTDGGGQSFFKLSIPSCFASGFLRDKCNNPAHTVRRERRSAPVITTSFRFRGRASHVWSLALS